MNLKYKKASANTPHQSQMTTWVNSMKFPRSWTNEPTPVPASSFLFAGVDTQRSTIAGWMKRTPTNIWSGRTGCATDYGSPGLLQTLAVLIAQKLDVKTAPNSSILPSAPKPLQAYGNVRFSVPIAEFDSIMLREVVYSTTVLKVSFYRERNKQMQKKPKERTRLAWSKPRVSTK